MPATMSRHDSTAALSMTGSLSRGSIQQLMAHTAFAGLRWLWSISVPATCEPASSCSGTRSLKAPSAISVLRSTTPLSFQSRLISDRPKLRRPCAVAIDRLGWRANISALPENRRSAMRPRPKLPTSAYGSNNAIWQGTTLKASWSRWSPG